MPCFSLYGKLCVRPDRKWEEMFYQCYESLHYSGNGEPNTQKAWEQIAIIVTSCSKKMKEKMAERWVWYFFGYKMVFLF